VTGTLLDYDPNDTGEIPRPVGETRTRIDIGETTQPIDRRIVDAPSFDAIPRRVIDMDDTVTFHIPATIGVVADTQQLTLLGSVAGVDGELRPAAPGPFPGPLPPNPAPAPAPKPGYVGRHRLSWGGRVRRLLARAGVAGALVVAVWAGLVLAALVVVR